MSQVTGSEFEIDGGEPDASGRCVLRVRIPTDLRYVQGHFPGDPIVPGIAQLLPLVYEPVRSRWPDLGAPSAVKRLKFLEALRPGQQLEVHLSREGGRVRFEIRRGETSCTTGSLIFD